MKWYVMAQEKKLSDPNTVHTTHLQKSLTLTQENNKKMSVKLKKMTTWAGVS